MEGFQSDARRRVLVFQNDLDVVDFNLYILNDPSDEPRTERRRLIGVFGCPFGTSIIDILFFLNVFCEFGESIGIFSIVIRIEQGFDSFLYNFVSPLSFIFKDLQNVILLRGRCGLVWMLRFDDDLKTTGPKNDGATHEMRPRNVYGKLGKGSRQDPKGYREIGSHCRLSIELGIDRFHVEFQVMKLNFSTPES